MKPSFFNKLFSKLSKNQSKFALNRKIIKILKNSVELQQAGSICVEKTGCKIMLQNAFHAKSSDRPGYNTESMNIYFFLDLTEIDAKPKFISLLLNGKSIDEKQIHNRVISLLRTMSFDLAERACSSMPNKDIRKVKYLEEQGLYGRINVTNYVRFDR